MALVRARAPAERRPGSAHHPTGRQPRTRLQHLKKTRAGPRPAPGPAGAGAGAELEVFEMKHTFALIAAISLASAAALAAPEKAAPAKSPPESAAPASVFTPRAVKSTGTVTVEGHRIAYDAMAGRIIVHPKGWDDATRPKGGNDAIGTADGP